MRQTTALVYFSHRNRGERFTSSESSTHAMRWISLLIGPWSPSSAAVSAFHQRVLFLTRLPIPVWWWAFACRRSFHLDVEQDDHDADIVHTPKPNRLLRQLVRGLLDVRRVRLQGGENEVHGVLRVHDVPDAIRRHEEKRRLECRHLQGLHVGCGYQDALRVRPFVSHIPKGPRHRQDAVDAQLGDDPSCRRHTRQLFRVGQAVVAAELRRHAILAQHDTGVPHARHREGARVMVIHRHGGRRAAALVLLPELAA
eukprot:scaffold1435_cov267-Pinguiococcus_pyrenoidosus.AAC.41